MFHGVTNAHEVAGCPALAANMKDRRVLWRAARALRDRRRDLIHRLDARKRPTKQVATRGAHDETRRSVGRLTRRSRDARRSGLSRCRLTRRVEFLWLRLVRSTK